MLQAETQELKKEESREIKSGEDKSIFELFKRDKKTSTPSEQSREQDKNNREHHSGQDGR